MAAKKRQCVLCASGTVNTDVPKDKAVCVECAREMMDGECDHECKCECHEPGACILHFMPCCDGPCHVCKTPIVQMKTAEHHKHCHKTLRDFQTP